MGYAVDVEAMREELRAAVTSYHAAARKRRASILAFLRAERKAHRVDVRDLERVEARWKRKLDPDNELESGLLPNFVAYELEVTVDQVETILPSPDLGEGLEDVEWSAATLLAHYDQKP